MTARTIELLYTHSQQKIPVQMNKENDGCMLYILTSFWVRRAPKSFLKHFLSAIFNLFFFFLKHFSMIFRLKSRKNMLLFQTFLNIFFLILVGNSLKNLRKEEKRLNTVKKKCFNQLSGARSTLKLVKIHIICRRTDKQSNLIPLINIQRNRQT